jgi:hypothetical protein
VRKSSDFSLSGFNGFVGLEYPKEFIAFIADWNDPIRASQII